MATKSSIQWTDATWNIARGCTKVDIEEFPEDLKIRQFPNH